MTFIDAQMVAKLCGFHDAKRFLARRAYMEQNGFPAPVHWLKRPLKWRRDQVMGWIEMQGVAQIHASVIEQADNVIMMKHAGRS